MKNLNNWVVNCQEDEDGFNLNPFDVFIDDSTNRNQDHHLNRKTSNSDSGPVEFIMNTTKVKRYANKITNSKAVSLLSARSNSL